MTNLQLQTCIRRLALDSSAVFFTDHACLRMQFRRVNDREVFVCLREGMVQRPPRVLKNDQEVRVRMDHYGSARNLAVVVSLLDSSPDLLIVTVITRMR